MNPFLKLSDSILLRLAEECEQGRFEVGDALQLSRRLEGAVPDAIAAELERLIGDGMSQSHLSYLLRNIVAARQSVAVPTLQLVWTGPDHTSSSRNTAVVLRELFASAQRSVLIVGFAVHRGREIFKELAGRMAQAPGLEVRMFLNIARALRDTTTAEQLIARFVYEFRREHWSGTRYPVIYYDPRSLALDESKRMSLHAKCVVVDGTTSFVTSANFTEAAQERNIEVGALIGDENFSRALVGQFDALIRTGAVQRLPLG